MKVTISSGIKASEIAAAVCGRLEGEDVTVNSIVTDSREVSGSQSCLFIALKGDKLDGHDYIEKSAACGAVCVLCEKIAEDTRNITAVVTGDSVKALGMLAAYIKARYKPLTVAVTGSVGKTTTKEFICAVLSSKYKTVKTEGNHNNAIGLPMTLLGLDDSTRAAVIEMGMSARGEIKYLTEITRPDIAVITNIGTSHIEKLGSREKIAAAKLEIVDGLSENGILLLNADEPLLADIPGARYVGFGESADYRAGNIVEGEKGTAFDLVVEGETVESIVIPTFGAHNVINAAFAYAAGLAASMGEFEIRRGLMNYKTTGMRQNLYTDGGRTILEDCYNASPESMIASLAALSGLSTRKHMRSVAVLGNMLELGDYSERGHARVGEAAARSGVGLLITFGKDAAVIADAAKKAGMNSGCVFSFDNICDIENIGDFILKNTCETDIIMFKASRGVALERVINYIKKNNAGEGRNE